MKPEKLKRPFVWNERQILIHDRVLYVPERCDEKNFAFPGWHSEETFGTHRPISVEYCSGNGAWITSKAKNNPEINWVAVELKFPRVQKIWSKLKQYNLDNLFLICGEGHRTTGQYFPSNSVDEVYINFPDPWPKRRHASNRIVQPAFISEIKRILRDQGTLTLVTDDEIYSGSMIADVQKVGGFQSLFPDPYYSFDLPLYGSSFFEDLWRKKGKDIRYHVFQKNPISNQS
jgi:tRNA (guanine-N7-)-methyltransferase